MSVACKRLNVAHGVTNTPLIATHVYIYMYKRLCKSLFIQMRAVPHSYTCNMSHVHATRD